MGLGFGLGLSSSLGLGLGLVRPLQLDEVCGGRVIGVGVGVGSQRHRQGYALLRLGSGLGLGLGLGLGFQLLGLGLVAQVAAELVALGRLHTLGELQPQHHVPLEARQHPALLPQ